MILAAGLGKRMQPLTETSPKPLLQVAGKALIEYQIERLAEAGVTEVVINHFYLGSMIEEALGNGSQFGIRIYYSKEPIRLETAGGIIKSLPQLKDDSFIVVNADFYIDEQGRVHEDPNAEGVRLTFSGISVLHRNLFADYPIQPRSLVPLLCDAMEQNKVSGEIHGGMWMDIGTPERLQEINDMVAENSEGS
jgi:MurNAc alpha-1-phosphate uridylyltransferase